MVMFPAEGTVSRKSIVHADDFWCFDEDGGTRMVMNPPPPIPDENMFRVPTSEGNVQYLVHIDFKSLEGMQSN